MRSVLDHVYGRSPLWDSLAEAASGLPVQWASDGRRKLPANPDSKAGLIRLLAGEFTDTAARARTGGVLEHLLVLSPGTVQLSYRRSDGWERERLVREDEGHLQRRLAKLLAKRDRLDVRLAADSAAWFGEWDYFAEMESVRRDLESVREALGIGGVKRGRSRCGEWSRRSRARMTRRLATLNWSGFRVRSDVTPAFGIVELAPCMVTLTYPGDYLAVAPTGEASKAHLRAFRAAWERFMGPSEAVWKLERQARGAPHYHLLLMVPLAHDRRHVQLREWARETWARIVGASGDDRMKHRRQGVRFDLAEAARYSDPQRIAVYFSKHNSADVDSPKAYQNLAPDGWVDPEDGGGVGRWWGYWRMVPVELSVVLDGSDALDVQRLLRGWVKAQKRVKRSRVDRLVERGRHVNVRTGEIRSGKLQRRAVSRRWTVRSLGGVKPAGFVLANDAAALTRAIGRALSDPPDWPPGQRRALP